MAESKIRDLAKELKVTSNEIIEFCVRRGATNISENTVVADSTAKTIRAQFPKWAAAKAAAAKAAAEKAAAANPPKKKVHLVFHQENMTKSLAQKKKPASKPEEPVAETAAPASQKPAEAAKTPESTPVRTTEEPVKAPEVKSEGAAKVAEEVREKAAEAAPKAAETPSVPEARNSSAAPAAEPEAKETAPAEPKQAAAPAAEKKDTPVSAVKPAAPSRTETKPQADRRDSGSRKEYQTGSSPRRDGDRPLRRDGQNNPVRRDSSTAPRRDGQGTGFVRRDSNTGAPRRDGQGTGFVRRDSNTGAPRRDGQGTGFVRRDGSGSAPRRDGQGTGFAGQSARGRQSGGGSRFGGGDAMSSSLNKNEARGGKGLNKKEREIREKNKQNVEKGERFEENTRGVSRQKNSARKSEQPVQKVEETIKTLVLPEMITIGELADKMKMTAASLIKAQFLKGNLYTINTEIPYEKAEEIALDYDIICEPEEKVDVIAELLKDEEDNAEKMVTRPPVVCVMGHVDHGKTSLLDAIRSTNITSREAGGITQHIGAYMVKCNGQDITFLDTPGHEAFTAMRMRGAQATDIAVLVVAADDGVMPQTIEAINHAKAANVDIIVAINKIDKPGANLDKVKKELSEHELVPEDWGGSTICVPVSAKTHEGLDTLLEMILLDAEVKELKADPDRHARGLVIEAQLDRGRGPVATILVQKGTLHVGDTIAVGSCFGKVRAMMDDKGRRIKEALPSTPVEILGLNDVPNAGEILVQTSSEKEARSFAETFIKEDREKMLADTRNNLTLDSLNSQIKEGNLKELNLIIKADVQGSVEAVKQSLLKLSNEEVVVRIIHGGVGAINESDVTLASASNAIIIGFDVRPDVLAKSMAEREKVEIRLYRVIYQAIADVEAAMKGMLDPIFEEKIIGHAQVRQIFKASGIGNIAGSYVTDGIFQRSCKIRIRRDGEQIYEGALASLKRFKDDVKEVREGYECGLVFEKFNDIREEDEVEAYIMEEVPR